MNVQAGLCRIVGFLMRMCHFSFQIFTCVVAFGLFHGLTFLPVVLSLIGPEPYDTSVTESDLKQYTDLTYRNGEISLNDLKKSKGVKMNGDLRKDIPNSNNQINEGFNDLAAEFDSSPVSKPFALHVCIYKMHACIYLKFINDVVYIICILYLKPVNATYQTILGYFHNIII